MSDDAFITFRTVDNFVSGYGLRWNVAERVQTYTHPLWMFLIALPYWLTREPYFTPLAVSIVCSTTAVWILVARCVLDLDRAARRNGGGVFEGVRGLLDIRAREPAASLVPVTIFALLGLLATTRPPLRSGAGTFILTPAEGLGVGGVADERAFYYRYTGLLRWTRAQPLPFNAEVQWGREAAASGQPVVIHPNVGLFGLFAGPTVHIIDAFALGDPLLARLPPLPGWRIGHFERAVPEGYAESVRTGRNVITGTAIAMKYEQVKLVTQGPLWSRRRWRAILSLNRP